MALTVSQLCKNNPLSRTITGLIKEQLDIIDSKIRTSGQHFGTNTITHEMPTVWPISGMERITSQKVIYGSVIKSLSQRGFSVRLSLTEDAAILFISWILQMDNKELDVLDKIIKSAQNTGKDITQR